MRIKAFFKTLIIGAGAFFIAAPAITGTTSVYAATGSKNATHAINWVKSKVGTGIDYDNYYGNQCVDLAKAYYAYLGQTASRGNGSDYTWNILPSGWSRLKGVQPQKGDILVYTGGWGGYGHVAIYESDYSHYHQNFNSHSYVERVTCKYNGNIGVNYWGVIRPDFVKENRPEDNRIAVTGVSLNKSSLTARPGWTYSLKAVVTPSNASDKKITWSSSNTSVATVDSKGNIKAKKTGTAVITVKSADSGKTAKCKVKVKLPASGLAKVGGVWRYYSKGKIDKKYTGLARNQKGWWYVSKGTIDFHYTGMAKSPKTGKWCYVKNGKLDNTFTGVARSPVTGKLYYMKKGVLKSSFSGTISYEGKRYKVTKGHAVPL